MSTSALYAEWDDIIREYYFTMGWLDTNNNLSSIGRGQDWMTLSGCKRLHLLTVCDRMLLNITISTWTWRWKSSHERTWWSRAVAAVPQVACCYLVGVWRTLKVSASLQVFSARLGKFLQGMGLSITRPLNSALALAHFALQFPLRLLGRPLLFRRSLDFVLLALETKLIFVLTFVNCSRNSLGFVGTVWWRQLYSSSIWTDTLPIRRQYIENGVIGTFLLVTSGGVANPTLNGRAVDRSHWIPTRATSASNNS